MLHSECNKVVPFFYRLFFRVLTYYLPSNEMPPPTPTLKSLATPLRRRCHCVGNGVLETPIQFLHSMVCIFALFRPSLITSR